MVAAALVLALGTAGLLWRQDRSTPKIQAVPTIELPGRAWQSGAFTGGYSPDQAVQFGAWRGSPLDTVITYPAYETWAEIESSEWHVSIFKGFAGRLVYGLPLLPSDPGSGTLADVAAGAHDQAFAAVAKALVENQRTDSYVRIGLEANGDWFPWGVGKPENTAADFKAAFAHVARLLREQAPGVTIVFDITCGHVMNGQSDRLDSLNALYPGDDVVDIVGCDHYDRDSTVTRNAKQWDESLRPDKAAGLQDVVDFARAHGKKVAFPEWGLAGESQKGSGDNPFYIYEMYAFFTANADLIAFENYFNEPETYLQSAIWGNVQNPLAAAEYAKLW